MGTMFSRRIGVLSFIVFLALVVAAIIEQHTITIPGSLILKPDCFGIEGQTLLIYDTDSMANQIGSIPPLIVYGNLVIEGECEMPTRLTVYGNLILKGDNISKLPEALLVGGNLDLRGTPVTSLPEKLEVGGEIYR